MEHLLVQTGIKRDVCCESLTDREIFSCFQAVIEMNGSTGVLRSDEKIGDTQLQLLSLIVIQQLPFIIPLLIFTWQLQSQS